MTKAMKFDPVIMTVGEVADYLHIHRSTVYKMLRSGELPAFRIGSDWRFRVEAIDRWRLERVESDLPPAPRLGDHTTTSR